MLDAPTKDCQAQEEKEVVQHEEGSGGDYTGETCERNYS